MLNLKSQRQEQLTIGTRKIENILPENMRNADTIKDLISILEYNRADSLGEAMNIVYSKRKY